VDVEINLYLFDLTVEKAARISEIRDFFQIDTGINTISSEALGGFVM
jgi:hypothetical protein